MNASQGSLKLTNKSVILGSDLLKSKSPIMLYPSMRKSLKRISNKVTAGTNTNPEGKHSIKPDTSDENLLGIRSISDLRSISRTGIRKNIHDFISHKKDTELNSNSQVNLKSYYLGHFKNPDFLHSISTNYENLNFKEYSRTKFGCFHKINQINKWSTLQEDPLASGC